MRLRVEALALGPCLVLASGCDEVRIGNTEALWLLWLVPALVAFHFFSFRRRRRLLERFASAAVSRRLIGAVSRRRQALKAALVLLAVAALAIALTAPKYGFSWEELERRGVDVVIALDVSDSMLVRDADGSGSLSRLERAKREITDLLRLLDGDRVGIVAFSGTAFVQCPLTLDYGAAQIFLDAIDPETIPVKGSDLAAGLETSLEALRGGARESLAVILITDGEDHSGRLQQVAEQAREEGVRVFPIGIGRDQGAPVPDEQGGFRRDRKGDIVLSRLDEPALQRVALTTGGRYVRSVTGDVDLEHIYTRGIKALLDDRELESERRQRWEERFQWLLALALPLLMMEPLISERRRGSADD
ncbi:MAG: VWA domain-containing protein [Thermoanaerobaculia bacterium]|nr:VWA domain-containing protein [Thermoanaerobaculia bacterium]